MRREIMINEQLSFGFLQIGDCNVLFFQLLDRQDEKNNVRLRF